MEPKPPLPSRVTFLPCHRGFATVWLLLTRCHSFFLGSFVSEIITLLHPVLKTGLRARAWRKAGDSMQKYHYSDYYLWFFFFFTLWLIFCCSASLVTPLGWHAPLWVPVDSTPTETEAENKPSCRYLQSLERKEFILDGINLWKVKNSIV